MVSYLARLQTEGSYNTLTPGVANKTDGSFVGQLDPWPGVPIAPKKMCQVRAASPPLPLVFLTLLSTCQVCSGRQCSGTVHVYPSIFKPCR